MKFEQVNFEEFAKGLESHKSCTNYLDVLLSTPEFQIKSCTFYKSSDNELISISHEGNVHFYGKSLTAFEELKNVLARLTSTGLLFSFFSNVRDIENVLGDKILNSKPFKIFTKKPIPQKLNNLELDFRQALHSDQSLVDKWFNEFNAEEGSTWSTPVINSGTRSNLYLVMLGNELVGAAANTLRSDNRFWIGRMWIKPEYRRQNIGSFLLRNLESEAAKETKVLSLLVSSNNYKAISFYTTYGFEEIGENCFWKIRTY